MDYKEKIEKLNQWLDERGVTQNDILVDEDGRYVHLGEDEDGRDPIEHLPEEFQEIIL